MLGLSDMPNNEVAQRAVSASSDLAEPLIDAFSASIAHVEREAKRYSQFRFPAMRPMMLRASVRMELENGLLPEGARLAGKPQQNCQLLIEYQNLVFEFLRRIENSFQAVLP
jgi:hypothetical protein